jgi:hypothetical protein
MVILCSYTVQCVCFSELSGEGSCDMFISSGECFIKLDGMWRQQAVLKRRNKVQSTVGTAKRTVAADVHTKKAPEK